MKLLAKRLSNQFIPLQVMFFFVIIVLALVSSSNVAAYASFGEEGTEAVALLKWKASLDNQSQSLLSSWVGSNNPCNNWVGIGCNNVGRVTSMNFTGCGLRELAYMVEVNENCDVYSFGVLTLEVIMGNHPGSLITSLPSYSSPSWSKPIADSILLKDVLDQRLPPPRNQLMVEVVFMVKLALSCLRISPKLRPTMKQVSAPHLPCINLLTQWKWIRGWMFIALEF
ncbi:MDIS1-interacting receptor like kinase 2 [Camellia lanceoleosa]|uniref:MDIS1-interacting receptor like kinase 2 n=1 Tax=Camellia lanceoleosa TaxID=1840588 RepID=A0ACC0HT51_9ERIC|nr:MDIS1-interacting receptor like kinase 2 [Camellia lanceoleosa]